MKRTPAANHPVPAMRSERAIPRAVRMTNSWREEDFRLQVMEKLTRLETMLAQLVGNGQPGRVQRLEEKVRRHDRVLWMVSGAGVVAGWLLKQLLG